MTCDHQCNTSAVPRATVTTVSSRFSFYAWTFLCLYFIACVLPYFFEADNSQNDSHFASQSPSSVQAGRGDSADIKVGRIGCGSKTNEVAPNNLPDFSGPFIGRDREVENIANLLHFAKHSHTKMVHIFGLPAVGKSTLAVHVGYEMARRGVVVQYIDLDETHLFRSHEHIVIESHDQRTTRAVSKRDSDIELSWYSHTEKKDTSTSPQGLIQWAKGLSNDTILIIDNCDLPLQNNSTFIEMFVDLNKASHYLHILTTSRLKLSLVDGFKLYTLMPLDNESAIELLQAVSNEMAENDSRIVNELIGGIPLALKIVGSLVNEMHPPSLIISELRQNLITTLTPEGKRSEREKMRPVLELSYKYLETNTQECALYLSHFPGSFSHEAASHILTNCTNSNSVKCVMNLTDSSLLNPYSYAGQPRYQFHKLIKEYLTDVESRKPSFETSKIAARFNLTFLTHYTQLLSGFVSRYNHIRHDSENIGRFKYESHNFECLLEKVHCFHEWSITPFINLTRSLLCQLMLETFTKMELLKVGQRSLVQFEDRMSNISAQIGVSESLNLYRDLVLQLRKWICSYPGNSFALCEETFLLNISSRYRAIDQQLSMSNNSKHDYYNQLRFPYYKSFVESYFCHSICIDFGRMYVNIINVVRTLLLCAIVMVKYLFKETNFLFMDIFWPCFLLCLLFLFHSAFVLSFIIVIFVSECAPLSNVRNNDRSIKLLFYILLYVILTGALLLTLNKDTAMFEFLSLCIETIAIVKWISSRVTFFILLILILVLITDAYIFEIETAHYVSSFALDLMYTNLGYFLILCLFIILFKLFPLVKFFLKFLLKFCFR